MLRGMPGLAPDEACAFEGENHLVVGTPKCRCISRSAGGRRYTGVEASMKARYWPCSWA